MRSITFNAAIAAIICTAGCHLGFAEHPKEGSVDFGAKQRPDIKSSQQIEAFKHVFADIAEKVTPTVVCITSTKIDTVMYQNPMQQFFFGSPFDDFFGQPQGRGGRPDVQKQEQRSTGVGSGVIVSADGYILTNNHVVEGANEITVKLNDDREFEAEIVGRDSLSDVAVIKIKDKVSDLPVAYIGDSGKLRPGDWVMAIGNPFNLNSTVTTGIVSAIGRHTDGTSLYQNFVQTDAAINPGNSGGALVNIDGELIGINSMIYTRSGGYMGIGFAIPINMAKNIAEQLIYSGKVSRGWIGVTISDMDNTMRDAMGMKSRRGVLVSDVLSGQPAANAGIKSGDVILSINGQATGNANDLRNTVAAIPAGMKIPVVILRDGKEQTLSLTVADRDGKNAVASLDEKESGGSGKASEADLSKKFGMSVSSISADVRDRLNLPDDAQGVVVSDVDQKGPAADKGIMKGDIILAVKTPDGSLITVNDPKTLKSAISRVDKGAPVLFKIQRGRAVLFVAVRAG